MEKKEENLYELFQKYSYTELKQLFKESKTKDEQDFYITLADMLLQKNKKIQKACGYIFHHKLHLGKDRICQILL